LVKTILMLPPAGLLTRQNVCQSHVLH